MHLRRRCRRLCWARLSSCVSCCCCGWVKLPCSFWGCMRTLCTLDCHDPGLRCFWLNQIWVHAACVQPAGAGRCELPGVHSDQAMLLLCCTGVLDLTAEIVRGSNPGCETRRWHTRGLQTPRVHRHKAF